MRVARAWHDCPGRPVRPLRRQHAPGGGHRRRQGRGRDRGLATRSTATGSATWWPRRSPRPPPAVDRPLRRVRGPLRRAPARCAAAAPATASLQDGARIELGLRAFLEQGGFKGFTTTFEDLHGLKQLPGLAVQRLMAEGYGFGAEGDWKTCALLRAMKVIGGGPARRHLLHGGLHLSPGPGADLVLGAHMLEICPSIAAGKPVAGDPSAGDRRQGGPRAPRVRRACRTGAQRLADRPGQPLPA